MALQPTAPISSSIPGLTFRSFQPDSDYPSIVDINNVCWPIDGREHHETIEDRRRHWQDTQNLHPANILVVEIKGAVIGYATISWDESSDQDRYYSIYATILPQWRRQGIGTTIQNWIELKVYEIDAQLSSKLNRYFDTYCFDVVEGKIALLKQWGYEVSWAGYMMDRSLSDPIPSVSLPEGFEVRPVQLNQIRAIYEALTEGHKREAERVEATEEQLRDFLAYYGQDTLKTWQVAWNIASNQVAAVVVATMNDHVYLRTGAQHGTLETLSTRHAWRHRGLARALITRSMEAFKAQGRGYATVGTMDDNVASNALYTSLGFQKSAGFTGFNKRVSPH